MRNERVRGRGGRREEQGESEERANDPEWKEKESAEKERELKGGDVGKRGPVIIDRLTIAPISSPYALEVLERGRGTLVYARKLNEYE